MPFLAPLVPALIGGAASAGAGAIVNAVAGGQQSRPGQVNVPNAVDQTQVNAAQQGVGQSYADQAQLAQQLAAQGGIQNQSDVYSQQQALAGQLGQMAQGGGPNPALAQLAQTTGANTANQAALMAGQRGAGANAGLIARQAAQQGGANQQAAVGQAATLRAQQQLAAIGALQNQQQNLAGLATQQVGQQSNAVLNQNQLAQANQAQLMNQLQNQNQLAVGQQQGVNQIQSQQGMQQAALSGKIAGGIAGGVAPSLIKGLGGSTAPITFAQGGEVPILKENYKGTSKIGKLLYAEGGKVRDMKSGGHVPGKPKVSGAKDSYSNDTVDAILSPGEIVLPRSVTMSEKPVEAAAKFVAAIKSKKGR